MSSEYEQRDKVIQSNRYIHSFLVGIDEYQKSPHFRPENQSKVRNIILQLTDQLNEKKRMVDFGCGTGFIINLAYDLFDEVFGVDITKEMMAMVDLSPGNITLVETLAEETPFDDDFFDFATAYSFMDHLFDYKVFLQEVYRVLKPGGLFYSDLNPNREFITAMDKMAVRREANDSTLHISREIKGALHNGEFYQHQFGLDASELEQAEPGKTINKGFLLHEVEQVAKDIGFSVCNIEFEWFINQGEWINQKPVGQANIIQEYLQSMRPLSDQFYKYLRFVLVK